MVYFSFSLIWKNFQVRDPTEMLQKCNKEQMIQTNAHVAMNTEL